jgi:hypothetical protein
MLLSYLFERAPIRSFLAKRLQASRVLERLSAASTQLGASGWPGDGASKLVWSSLSGQALRP